MGNFGKHAPEKKFGMNGGISAYLDLAACLLIVAFLFHPAPLAGLLDAEFIALFGFFLAAFVLAGRGMLAILLLTAIEIFGLFAKTAKSKALIGLSETARGFFFYNLVAFFEGFFWMLLFGAIYTIHYYAAPLFAKEALSTIAHDSFSLLVQCRILEISPQDEYAFFTLLLFFMASTFFGLFLIKKWNYSLSSKIFAIGETNDERERYNRWIRVYVRRETG